MTSGMAARRAIILGAWALLCCASAACQHEADAADRPARIAQQAPAPQPAPSASRPARAGADADERLRSYVRAFQVAVAPMDWLKAHPLSIDETRALRAYSKKLLGAGEPRLLPFARSAAMAAAMNLVLSGEFADSLDAWLDAMQVDFMIASDGPSYDAIRTGALSMAAKAEQIGQGDIRARFFILAADASRFKFVGERQAHPGDLMPDQLATLSTLTGDFEREADALGDLRTDNAGWFVRAREMIVLIARDLDQLRFDPHTKPYAPRFTPLLKKLNACAFEGPASWRDSRSVEMDTLLGRLLYAAGAHAAGRARLEAIVADPQVGEAHSGAWAEAMGSYYQAERDQGATVESLAPVRRALSDNDGRVRAKYRTRLGRLMIAGVMAEAYARMLRDELFAVPSVDEAFAAIERDKARALLDDLKLGAPSVPAELAAREDALRLATQTYEANDQLQSDLLEDNQVVSLVPLRLEEGRGEFLEQIEGAYAQARAGLGAVSVPTTAAEVQRLLGPDEALVDYHLLRTDAGSAVGLAGVVLTHATAKIILRPFQMPPDALNGVFTVNGMQPIDTGPLVSKVAVARGALARGAVPDSELKQLYSLLIIPVLATIPPGIQRLIFSPDGVLNAVPFPVLRSETGHFLIQDFTVSTAESASVWLEERKRDRRTPGALLGIFAPMAASGPDAALSIRSEPYPFGTDAGNRFWAPQASSFSGGKPDIVARLQAKSPSVILDHA